MKRTVVSLAAFVAVWTLSGCGGGDSALTAETTPAAAVAEVAAAEKVIVPDVSGMSPDEATAVLESKGFDVAMSGEGTEVSAQSPAAGTSVDEGSGVTIALSTPEPTGTLADPFPVGTTLAGTGASGVEEVSVALGIASWGAGDIVMAENQFNDPAPEGSVYVLLPVTITNLASEEAVIPWLAVTVSYVAPDGRSYDEASAVIPGELMDIGDLYIGGSATGNMAFVLPTTAQGGVWAVSYGWSDPVFVTAG